MKPYQDERYCGHCDKDTQQTCIDSEHERDSSQDWRRCLECGWEYTGFTGQWAPPLTREELFTPSADPVLQQRAADAIQALTAAKLRS